jgi:hypothetical protein
MVIDGSWRGTTKDCKGIQTKKHCTRMITGICVAHPLLKIITENSYVHLLCTWNRTTRMLEIELHRVVSTLLYRWQRLRRNMDSSLLQSINNRTIFVLSAGKKNFWKKCSA